MPIHILAGIDFNTGIRGILVVTLAVVVLPGSVYLLLATNTGARLGLLIALAALFGWASILTMTWWITSPANGPRGRNASWKPVEIYVEGSGPARTVPVHSLPSPSKLPQASSHHRSEPRDPEELPEPVAGHAVRHRQQQPRAAAQVPGRHRHGRLAGRVAVGGR